MAETRLTVNRRKRNEELRDKFKVAQYIVQMEKCYDEYNNVAKDLAAANTKKAKLTAKEVSEIKLVASQIEILNARVMVTKAKVDLNLRRLKFVLPELRAIELTDGDGGNPLAELSQAIREAVGAG